MKISATINRLVDKPDSSIKAFASVSFDGYYAVHGIKVCESDKGRFVSMPATPYTDHNGNKQYQDIFHPISKDARNALNRAVLNAYELKLQQIRQIKIEVENIHGDEFADEPAEEPEPEMCM
jgi:stage V sporulation protein G